MFGQPMLWIEEGQFYEGQLCGFGRRLGISTDMKVSEYIGNFKTY